MRIDDVIQYITNCSDYDELVLLQDALAAHDWQFLRAKKEFDATYPDFKLDKFTHEHHGHHETEDHYMIKIRSATNLITISCGDYMGDEYMYFLLDGVSISHLSAPYQEMTDYLIRNFSEN